MKIKFNRMMMLSVKLNGEITESDSLYGDFMVKLTWKLSGMLASVSFWPLLIIESVARVSQNVLFTHKLLVKQV